MSEQETRPEAAAYLDLVDTLAKRAGQKRRPGDEKDHADRLLAQMRADGLLAVAVPPEFDGPGLGVMDCARITFRIARQSGSAGLTYAMHMSQAFSVVRGGTGPFFEDYQRRMVAEQILIASGTSEKGLGGDILKSICTMEAVEGGFTLTKDIPNISYTDHAGAYLVSANRTLANGRKKQVLVLVEASGAEIAAPYETQFLGMRGILNRPVALTARFPEAAIFGSDFPALARTVMTPVIQILWAALWSGIAWSVLDTAKLFVSKEMPADSEVSQVVRHRLTQLINKHYMMNAMIRDAAADYDGGAAGDDLGFGRSARINRLKICASELVNEICAGANQIIGIRGYATGGPYSIAEPVADAMSAGIMVSNFRLAMNNARIESFVDEAL